MILKVHSHYLMLTNKFFLARKICTIEGKFLFLYKKLSTLLFQLYKTLPLEVRNQKHPAPFFYGTLYCWFLKTNNMQKLYKTKCMIRKYQPIMNMKEIKSLTKNLELQINQWNKHVQNRVIMTQSFKVIAQRLLLRKLKIIMTEIKNTMVTHK